MKMSNSNCQIRFLYKINDVIIKCERNEQMRDIINRFGINSGLQINEFDFLYRGKKINPDRILAQINNKDLEILILVYPNNNIINKNQHKVNKIKILMI